MLDTVLVTCASLLAGTIDAIVGGGGLILVPALFATYPAAPPATLLGTNKSASVWGTLMAGAQYLRRVSLDRRVFAPAMVAALAGSLAGAWAVSALHPGSLRKALPLVLLAVLAYTLMRKDLGRQHQPLADQGRQRRRAVALGAVVGAYDGFFGPGTGSFFIFGFVRLLGYDFLHASAAAKLLNLVTHAAALALLAAKGHVWWHLGLPMAVANIAGGLIGSRLALHHGAGFVRGVFIVVVSALILKTARDAFFA